jgi:hypothetical protein
LCFGGEDGLFNFVSLGHGYPLILLQSERAGVIREGRYISV